MNDGASGGGAGRSEQQSSRLYAGLTGEERRARRRRMLIDAAFDLAGGLGYQAATVRGICKEAGLSERYFYENFASREEIFSAVCEHVSHSARDEVISAIAGLEPGATPSDIIDAGVDAFIRYTTIDERRVTVIFVDVPGVTTNREVIRVDASTSFSELIEHAFVEVYGVTHPLLHHMSIALVGMVARILGQWRFDGADPAEIDGIVETCRICFAAITAEFAAQAAVSSPTVNDPEHLAETLGRAAESTTG